MRGFKLHFCRRPLFLSMKRKGFQQIIKFAESLYFKRFSHIFLKPIVSKCGFTYRYTCPAHSNSDGILTDCHTIVSDFPVLKAVPHVPWTPVHKTPCFLKVLNGVCNAISNAKWLLLIIIHLLLILKFYLKSGYL